MRFSETGGRDTTCGVEYKDSWRDSKGGEEVEENVIHDTGACHTDGCRGNVRVGHSVLGTPLELGHRVPERFKLACSNRDPGR